ncbi:putative neural-cadherin 2 isoform X2 [Eriocheir sinensis]|uniref:putative neural-cadherin 2 isoform X2 n=1 Tax=Eriocheir sinensis TaxID=95602 RepID=UPI0021CA893D|nr:putative neural-cadherin 2 isoform X2 [Eriocheir sinensis]
MDPGKIFQIITNSTLLATRLLPAGHTPLLEFSSPRYCAALPEDRPPGGTVTTVTATHRHGAEVRYSITGGNRDGLFTIDQRKGIITLAAALDYEISNEHELVVSAEGDMEVTHTVVQLRVTDVNDNPPVFLNPDPRITLVEEDDRDLPAPVAKVMAVDADSRDAGRLVYRVIGDGTHHEETGGGGSGWETFFAIHARTGDLIQLKALDRDPPQGRDEWRLRVEVRDGQWWEEKDEVTPTLPNLSSPTHHHRQASWGHREPEGDTHIGESRGQRRGGVGVTVPSGYRSRRAERRASLSDFMIHGTERLISSPLYAPDAMQTAEATTRLPGFSRRAPGKLRNQDSYSFNPRLDDDKVMTSRISDTGGKNKNPPSDPSASADLSDSRGTVPRDLEMRHVAPPFRKVRHALFYPPRLTFGVQEFQRELREDPHLEQRRRQGSINEDDVKVSVLGEDCRKPLEMKQLLADSSVADPGQHDAPETLSDRTRGKGDRTNLRTNLSQLPVTRGTQGMSGKSSRRQRNPKKSRAGHKEAKLSLFSPGRKHSTDKDQQHNAAAESTNTRLLQDTNVSESFTASRRLVRSSQRRKGHRVKRDATDADYGGLEGIPTEERGCDEAMFDYGDGGGDSGWRVHVVETVVTVKVKDINDNAPVFPDTTILGAVEENGATGARVVEVKAWDADDDKDGSNARLTYAIEKNVVDEASGSALFSMEPHTGQVRTARCCLDREATPEYRLQVVAADGGGLKGTGTVVVRVTDENDNPPRLARRQWELEVDETPPYTQPPNTTLLKLTATDKDDNNTFLYRVVPGSGPGWENFGMRSLGSSGQLFALRNLDYEEESHRRGFRFMVQVTDQGSRGWEDLAHIDSAWITIQLRDVNDNPPVFSRPNTHVKVQEDAALGTLLATMPAHDPDMGGTQDVNYRLEGGWGALAVDANGGVSLRRQLDREAPGGASGKALVVAVDRGSPPLSATATITITVTDVNDCPPRLLPPTRLHVTEGGPSTRLGVLRVTDPDVWGLGHGPPFTLALAPTNPPHVFSLIELRFDQRLESGRGGAELWTRGAVDREQHRQLSVAVRVSDAQGLAATHRLTVLVDDLNDNPMKPAAKAVYLWKTQGAGSEAPLGRVFVDDPDDWDLGDKEFEWAGPPHPLFTLHPRDGTILASSQVREGRYELHFSVSDRAWRQRGVAANVTVAVRLLTPEALAHAAPLALTPTTPADLTRGWSPAKGGGGLGSLLKGVKKVLEEPDSKVEVVSVYGGCAPPPAASPSLPPTAPPATPQDTPPATPPATPSTCVWVSVRDTQGSYMNAVKLQGLLALHTRQLEAATNLTVVVDDPAALAPTAWKHRHHHRLGDQHTDGGDDDVTLHSAASLASTRLPLQVVDTNATALVTPRLTRAHSCHAHAHTHAPDPEDCTPTSCLNGGRCVRTEEGNDRCVCPGGASGPQCKVLSRTFLGSGWLWLHPLPPCLPVTLSLRLLTSQTNALLLYSGPLAPTPHHATPTPMLALQLVDGRPQALLEGESGPLKLQVNSTLNDGHWHTLHLALDSQGVVMMVDLCGRGWKDGPKGDAHCLTRARWRTPRNGGAWLDSVPLQVGGLAHSVPRLEDHGWREAPTQHHLTGCLARLTINSQVLDLGEPVYNHATESGCRPQDVACSQGPGGCGLRGQCVGGLKQPRCECDPGWRGPGCSTPTVPARLGSASYMKVALSFTPGPRVVRVQVRVRFRGARSGLLLQLAAHHRAATYTLHLQAGVACASVSGAGWAARQTCVERRPLGDGAWHTIAAERHGDNLLVSVDDGNGWHLNETLASLAAPNGSVPPPPLIVDKHDGVTVGGLPEFRGVDLVTVQNDLQDTCLDDLRVSGHPLPLSPAVNGTSWGQVTTLEQLTQGCSPARDPCIDTSCASPLSCHPVWDQPSCSCGPGGRQVASVCEDVDECLWRPCLHGGSCHNLRPGFLCVCGPDHLGDHCQWAKIAPEGHPITAPAAIAAITVSVLVLAVLGMVLSLRRRRLRVARGLQAEAEKVSGSSLRSATSGAGNKAEEGGDDTMLELLRLKVSGDSPEHRREGIEGGSGGGSSGGGITPMVVAAAQHFPVPPPPKVFQSEESIKAYAYEEEMSSTLSDLTIRQTGGPCLVPGAAGFLVNTSAPRPALPDAQATTVDLQGRTTVGLAKEKPLISSTSPPAD